MPLYDYKCQSCGAEEVDVMIGIEDEYICNICGETMTRQVSAVAFTLTPNAISVHKKKFGNKLPDNYKIEGGCNVIPPKNK